VSLAITRNLLPRGYQFSAMACGLRRKNRADLGLITSEVPATAAGVFTTNLVKAAPVLLCQEHVRSAAKRMRAIVVNSGNANCATGPGGLAASRATAKNLARALGCRAEQVLVCSTGVIGVLLPVKLILNALPELTRIRAAGPEEFGAFTRAIMTTDTRPKWAAATCRIGGKAVRLLGCAKGAGMIHPQMGTMLAYIVTDAAIAPALLRRMLVGIADRTFNSITVDGDTSTNDTALVLANGASGARAIRAGSADHRAFATALEKVCRKLALEIVADGEGASRVIEIDVRGARTPQAAEQVARTIAGSPLVKTALAGADPNWGRILAAAGRSGVKFDPARANISMAGMPMYRGGRALNFDERAAHERLLKNYILIVMDLHAGRGRARIWTCDFTADYVHINASYRT
jgi:glutamate N-acetyltransferase/amino-acid N-acetyltransferase